MLLTWQHMHMSRGRNFHPEEFCWGIVMRSTDSSIKTYISRLFRLIRSSHILRLRKLDAFRPRKIMQTKILSTHTHTHASINDMGKGSWCILKGKKWITKIICIVYVKFLKDWKYRHKTGNSGSIWWGAAGDFHHPLILFFISQNFLNEYVHFEMRFLKLSAFK